MNIFDIKRKLRKETSYLTDGWNQVDREYLESRMYNLLAEWQNGGSILDPDVVASAVKSLCDDFAGYGPLQDFLDDPYVNEIMANGPYKIYVEKNGHKMLSSARFDDEDHMRYMINKMVHATGRRVDNDSPCADVSLPDGSRVNITIPPLSVDGISITIRKLVHSIKTLEDIINLGTLDVRMAEFLVGCLRGKLNILFAGATGTGKTTTINILSPYIDETDRVITIEDTLELNMGQGNIVRLLTRPADAQGNGYVGTRFLFTNALRMSPSRIILGEVRGMEALDYIQALNSGHRGTLAVLHAATPRDSITRLETLALYAGLDLPSWSIRKQIESGLDLIVQHEQLLDGSRKITYITELVGIKDDEIDLKDIYRYEIDERDTDLNIKGRFVAMGPPTFLSDLAKLGIQMDDSLFI